jgi:hypothetical protein
LQEDCGLENAIIEANKPVDATARSPVVEPESPAPPHHL